MLERELQDAVSVISKIKRDVMQSMHAMRGALEDHAHTIVSKADELNAERRRSQELTDLEEELRSIIRVMTERSQFTGKGKKKGRGPR